MGVQNYSSKDSLRSLKQDNLKSDTASIFYYKRKYPERTRILNPRPLNHRTLTTKQ